MTSRDPHIPIRHARSAGTRVLDHALAGISAREPLATNDPVLQGLAHLVTDIDLVVDRVAPSPRSSTEPPIVLTDDDATVLPADGDKVRPLGRRRQTWSVLTASGIAASFVAASLLSSCPPATTSPSLVAAAETKALLAHATNILPSATASNAAHVAYARELAADLTHAAALLPQVQDSRAHASLAERLATLQQQAPTPATPTPPQASPAPSRATSPQKGAQPPARTGQPIPQKPAQPGAGQRPPIGQQPKRQLPSPPQVH